MAGMVYLVGAGPGDYKLISVKAWEYIQIADTIVYDRLADDRLLRHARKDVEMIYVGKASSQHTMRQEDINQLLVDKAKEGKTVVRLKGGDPFVFGRGGEEALLLVENNLPFEIVPGITSAISVPAYAGIPVTHRAVATSFAVITGHEDPTKGKSNMRWDKLSTGVDTLVFLMGVENLPHITSQLIKNGRPAETPAAVIRWGTKPEQRVLVTTVGTAAEDVAKQGLKPPAIFIVGDVVNLREKLAWFDNRPLFGKNILVTRAREQASVLTNKLEALGANCIEAPAIKIALPDSYEAIDSAIANIASYHWLIFTSANGVDHFFARLDEKGLDSRVLSNAKIAAIGVSTANQLRTYGIKADLIPAEFRAEGIIEILEDKIDKGMKILIPRAKEAREILPEKLREMGAIVDVAPVYQTVIGEVDSELLIQKLQDGEIDLVTFTSSSTVTNLLSVLSENGKNLLSKTKTACIGPITAKTCIDYGIEPTIVAEDYTITGLVKSIEELVK
ncbi:MAG: uroporphyrin-III C-methyltransferase [Firmicutes bacterium]|nr:uroporphyrin-III C-methyltransferase [Bacillota bacterium]